MGIEGSIFVFSVMEGSVEVFSHNRITSMGGSERAGWKCTSASGRPFVRWKTVIATNASNWLLGVFPIWEWHLVTACNLRIVFAVHRLSY
jgi:hypothetical protein